jgi:hypothetical protein|nr:MAG TPA: tail-collar fiber protein [Caudoviricetes sp.]
MDINKIDSTGVSMTGEITDYIYKNGVLVDTIKSHNLVVNSFLNLVMCLLKNQSGHLGIQYWAVGSGNTAWDTAEVQPTSGETRLTVEIGRVPILPSEITFLNSSFNEVSTPTNIIQVKHTFGTNDCNGAWREFGIFGGNATTSANSGILINKKHHKLINKTSEMTVERVMRFTLNLV